MEGSSEEIQFSWGKRRGIGGDKRDILFYHSFTLDNVKYSLYDCVYLFKTGDPEPHIGKIVKTWEQNGAKKVKILWFFLPDEIQKYLDGPVMENEVFLACGNGRGLADINPPEAIAGKCTVICTSKDARNRQPSPREQAMADYIFYRFFDVEKCTLSDLLPDKIAGLKVDDLLNPKDEQVTSISGKASVEGGVAATGPQLQSVVKEDDENPVAAVSLSQSVGKENGNLSAAVSLPQSVAKEDQKPDTAIPISPLAVKNEHNENLSAAVSLPQSVAKEDHRLDAAIPISRLVVKKEHNRPVVAVPHVQSPVKDEENEKSIASAPSPRSAAMEKTPKRTQNASPRERPAKKLKWAQETMQSTDAAVPDKKPFELTSKEADRSKWFKIPWDERLRSANEQGRLVYIQNLDVQFAAADIEELIREALELKCTAIPINHPTYDDPNNGKAYAIFRNETVADEAISKINSGLVVGQRPLYCSKGQLKVPKPTGPLVGHLSLNSNKISLKQREEQKKAISTSHCSQPNTIEYELALDWMLLREKQEEKFGFIHKRHEDHRKGIANMGSKSAKNKALED